MGISDQGSITGVWFYSYNYDSRKPDVSNNIDRLDEHTELSLDYFKKYILKQENEMKKIIGYKAPMDLFGGNIKVDTKYRATSSHPTPTPMYAPIINGEVYGGFDYQLPAEIVKQWIPIYEDEFEVDDWVTIKYCFDLERGCHGCPEGTFQIVNEPSQCGLYDEDPGFVVKTTDRNWRISEIGVRKATPEEILKSQTKKLYFGSVKFTIKSGSKVAETGYGDVPKEEISKVIDYIKNPPRLIGHPLSIHHDDTQNYHSLYTIKGFNGVIKIGFGCQSGSVAELEAIYKAFDE